MENQDLTTETQRHGEYLEQDRVIAMIGTYNQAKIFRSVSSVLSVVSFFFPMTAIISVLSA